ncbi:Lrp/AsnC ligand binding domain-containing protein [Leptolyngbya sp. FACHB-541]|uniref:Lrp/AsnC ligand binding domain-containing protein n=1 Tax=Leptolyngbya sp. FACHB-541 TaxID=2692810 RepID=UPI0016869247|nr:Lrp/AsnC ligand binding domain-containing protein [Leptolyngbya sp. FACHB-541]MBD2000079.1 Lrp/AsnC ligand binding domain-containing protein [Leptolyngbya sp. FACHB-541]
MIIAKPLQKSDSLSGCHRVVGNECYILKAVLPSMQHLEGMMERFLQLGAVEVSIILSTVVTDKAIQNQS